MSLFGEAIRSAFLPCSFALLIPAVVVTALSRSSTLLATVGVYLTAASLLAWLPFIRVTTPLDHNLGGAIALGAGLTIFLKTRGLGASLGAGALLGAFAGSTWLPCVGAEFGGILNSGLEQPSSALIPMLIYVLGVLQHLARSDLARLVRPGDLVVANDAATLPASLDGTLARTGEKLEIRLAGFVETNNPTRFVAVLFGAGTITR